MANPSRNPSTYAVSIRWGFWPIPRVISVCPSGFAVEFLWRYTSGYVTYAFRSVTRDVSFITLRMFRSDTRNMVVDLDVFWRYLSVATLNRFSAYPYTSEIASRYLLARYMFVALPYFIEDFLLFVASAAPLAFPTMQICRIRKFRNTRI